MSLMRLLYRRIDPERLISDKAWLAQIALGAHAGLLFIATILLVLLERNAPHATGGIFKGILATLCIVSGIVFVSVIYGMVRISRSVMRERIAFRQLSEDQKSSATFNKNLIDILPIGYHSINKHGIVIEMNETELNWLGYSREEVIGIKHAYDIYGHDYQEEPEKVFETLNRNGFVKNAELNLVTKHGQLIPALVNSKAVYDTDHQFSHSITTAYNFTERKKLENELIQARQEAENAWQMKQLFMANMSHEIRTPLNAILGFSNLLAKTEMDTRQKEYVKSIKISGSNLLTIVNDILDFEKIGTGMLRIEQIEFDLPGLLHSVVTMVRPAAEEKKLQLRLESDAELPTLFLGDPMRLTQILINLLGNSIKFTETGSVTLRVKAIENTNPEEPVHVRFEVEDTGIGIPKSEHTRIFERFTQSSSEMSRIYGGTGLGLALVKMLVELQNGIIYLDSDPGWGSVFTIEIPYQVSREKETTGFPDVAEPDSLPVFKGNHVLVVEDNPMNRRIAELNLLDLGLKVTLVEDGYQAIQCLQEKPAEFDLVLMDIQMPGMDGYATAKAIRQDLRLTALPVVAMTAHVLSGEREKVLACGMNDYLTKPVNQRELLAVLKRYIDHFWNASAVHSFTGNNPENFRELVQLFMLQLPAELTTLHEALEKADYQLVVQTTHNLRSTVGYAGFQASIGETLLQMEMEARKEQPDAVLLRQLNTNATQECKRAIILLERELNHAHPTDQKMKDVLHILLADDDRDDYLLFKLALDELAIAVQLTTVSNGEQLMLWLLQNPEQLPDILFLDLNMPRKNGFQCLGEIKQTENLRHIPVIIYSTSFQKEVVNMLYNYGAYHYIQKPNDFDLVKQVVQQAINSVAENGLNKPPRENFVMSAET